MAINPFAQPINYSAQFVDLTPAFRAAGEGFRAIGEGIQEREKQEQTMTLKAQYSTDLQNALNNPTQATWSQMIAKYPQQREAFAEARKGFGETALANEFNQGFEVSTALENKRPEVAKERLQTFITARKNSNLPTGIYEDALEALERNDVLGAQANVNSALAMADPDRFQKQVEARLKASTAPSALKKSVADADAAVAAATTAQAAATNAAEKAKADAAKATADAAKAKVDADVALATKPSVISEAASKAATAKVTAEFAERKELAVLNLNKAQIANYATQQDIARQNARIAGMQADAAKESNALKRQELQLKIDTAKEARDQSVLDKYSQAQNVLATFDNTLVSVDKILNNWGKTKDGKIDPNLSNRTVKSATGPVQSRIFTTSQDVADFEEQVGSLESQAFLSQVEKMRGLGALTEKEGARLVNALASLSLRQSPKQLAENMLVVRDLMQKARSSAAAKFGDLQSKPTAPAAIKNVTVDY
jgi:hypothetical protein